MCYKLVDDESGKIICQLVIRSATEPSTANLCVNPIKPLPPDAIYNTEPDAMLEELMTLANFETPFFQRDEKDTVDLIPTSTKLKTWQQMEMSKQEEHQ